MTDLLVFYPKGRHLYIEFLGAKYIERQPKTPEETANFAIEIRPIIQQLDDYVLKHGLKEIIELNLKDVPISKLNSESATHLLKLMVELRPDKNLLEKIRVTNSNPVFNMIYKGVKTSLPSKITDLVEIEAPALACARHRRHAHARLTRERLRVRVDGKGDVPVMVIDDM
jgi:hypothetical protein